MIDTHCHLDQIDAPEAVVRQAEAKAFTIIAVTNLPSHYAMALPHLDDCRYVKPALGFHPLMAGVHPEELMPFIRLATTANCIGEIGLDFSPKGTPTKEAQLACFDKILDALKGKHRFVTVHSRQAVLPVLNCLQRNGIGPVVFHWFTGSRSELEQVISAGHYLSINPAMLSTSSGKRVMEMTPKDRILTETDAPFALIAGRTTLPWDVEGVLGRLATLWKTDRGAAEKIIAENFARLLPSARELHEG